MTAALIGVIGVLIGTGVTGWFNRRTSRDTAALAAATAREVAVTAAEDARAAAAVAAAEARAVAAMVWHREHAYAALFDFLALATKSQRLVEESARGGLDPSEQGHDLGDAEDGWLDRLEDAAEPVALYGSAETAAAAEDVISQLYKFGGQLPAVPPDIAVGLTAAITTYRTAVRADLGIERRW